MKKVGKDTKTKVINIYDLEDFSIGHDVDMENMYLLV